jgi:uncharacterized protein (PEP-CTERM system associated)
VLLKLKHFLTLSVAVACALPLHARQLEFTANVNTTYVNEESETTDTDSTTLDTFSIQPSLGARYRSGRFTGSGNIRYRQLDRHVSQTGSTVATTESRDNYTTYNANTEFELLENALFFTLNGNQTYRSFDINDSLTDDEFNDDGSLSKTRRTQVGLRFKSPQADYLVLDLNARASKVKSDNGDEQGYAVNSDDKFLRSLLTSGDRMDQVTWDINSNYRKSEGATNNDLTSTRHYGNLYFGIYDELRFLITGRYESNERFSATEDVSEDLDYDSYGVGLSWGKEARRRINLTYTRSGNANNDEKESFVGLDVNWAFTSRTSVRAELSRRYFGESGSFSLRHNSRRIRTSVTYSEDLTTFSQIIGSELSEETFVCPSDATDFSECFQPPTLNYELNAGEQFTSFGQLNPIISEEVRLRKALQSSIGYDFRRLRTTLNIRRTSTDFLDSGREQTSEVIGLTGNLRTGVKTSFTASVNYQKTEDSLELEQTESEIWTANFAVNRTVGRSSRVSLGFRHIERKTDELESLSENRITLSFNYRFNQARSNNSNRR